MKKIRAYLRRLALKALVRVLKATHPADVVQVSKLLNEANEILSDLEFKEGKLPTDCNVKTELPEAKWRSLNDGAQVSRSGSSYDTIRTELSEAKWCLLDSEYFETWFALRKEDPEFKGNTSLYKWAKAAWLAAVGVVRDGGLCESKPKWDRDKSAHAPEELNDKEGKSLPSWEVHKLCRSKRP